VRRRCRRAWGRRSRHGRLLRRASKAPLARHLPDCLGETPNRGWRRSFRSSARTAAATSG
jgi:hypothetical protein